MYTIIIANIYEIELEIACFSSFSRRVIILKFYPPAPPPPPENRNSMNDTLFPYMRIL